MFDITSSKLLILAIVALIVVGPKDLPILLRTVGKYLGVIRRHAAEFRAQLDEALREAEVEELKKEFASVGQEMEATIAQGSSAIDSLSETTRFRIDSAREGVASEAQAGANDDKAEAAPEADRAEKTGT